MNRSKFVAVVVALGVVAALVAAQLAGSEADDGTEAAAPGTDVEATGRDGSTDPTAAGEDAADEDEDDADEVEEVDTSEPDLIEVAEAPPILDPKPELTDIDGWLQTDATSLADFDGQVRIVEFWTFGCFNCKNRLPHTQALYEEYHPKGLEIVGVHAPEFDFERDPDRIAEAAIDLGVIWPIALDTNKTNFRAWQGSRRFWPRVYVLDQDGQIRYDHIGEGDYDGLEEVVDHLIENGP